MLKVTSLVFAVAAALGMSSAGAQTTPGGSSSGWSYYTHPDGTTRVYAGGNPVGGFQATPSGNATKFTYAPSPASPGPVAPSSPSAGNYTTIKRLGDGFTLEQKANIPVPGRDLSHPVALRKPIPKAAMAKAFAKTLPILGNALALKELLEEVFDKPMTWDPSAQQWNYSESGGTEPVYVTENYGTTYGTSVQSLCAGLKAAMFFNTGTIAPYFHSGTVGTSTEKWDCGGTGFGGYYIRLVGFRCPGTSGYTFQPLSCAGPTTAVTETSFQEKLGSLFSFPPEADDLLPAIPEQARDGVQNTIDASR